MTFDSPEDEYRFYLDVLSDVNLRGAVGNAAQIACQHPGEITSQALLSALQNHYIYQVLAEEKDTSKGHNLKPYRP